jgi:hypothetical protein
LNYTYASIVSIFHHDRINLLIELAVSNGRPGCVDVEKEYPAQIPGDELLALIGEVVSVERIGRDLFHNLFVHLSSQFAGPV